MARAREPKTKSRRKLSSNVWVISLSARLVAKFWKFSISGELHDWAQQFVCQNRRPSAQAWSSGFHLVSFKELFACLLTPDKIFVVERSASKSYKSLSSRHPASPTSERTSRNIYSESVTSTRLLELPSQSSSSSPTFRWRRSWTLSSRRTSGPSSIKQCECRLWRFVHLITSLAHPLNDPY